MSVTNGLFQKTGVPSVPNFVVVVISCGQSNTLGGVESTIRIMKYKLLRFFVCIYRRPLTQLN